VTANPHWPEIVNELRQGEQPWMQPDLITRDFKHYLDQILEDILKRHTFGRVRSHVHVIEFQKRGLPHSHILLILHERDKIRATEDYDKFVSAEIPDVSTHPRLFNIVTRTNLHGPCGPNCMKNGHCSEQFPKDLFARTFRRDTTYPTYMRRSPSEGGQTETEGTLLIYQKEIELVDLKYQTLK
jgi:Helitron helicase-like domain at N-terminus